MTELMNFEERARAVLPPHISAYYAAAAGSGVGLDEGTVDWSAVRFRPRILREVGSISVSTTVLGSWPRELSGLPVLVKGVLRADDARRCVDAGAAGAVVSTHGGRRLGPTISAARALPEIVAAIGDQAEIYADSGIRSGEHVAAAIAMGARAIFIGRPALWAPWPAAGQENAQQVIKSLTDELAQVMVQLGATSIDGLTPDLLSV
ncbi:MAG TPA: alpha-hydroxy acid oxidase [Propionibacteriaceae bacterium]|jgi:4-hydroxymandelate oxidase